MKIVLFVVFLLFDAAAFISVPLEYRPNSWWVLTPGSGFVIGAKYYFTDPYCRPE